MSSLASRLAARAPAWAPARVRAPAAPSAPGVPAIRAFAAVAALEAGVRGTLLSVWPLAMIRAWGDGAAVSAIYLGVGATALLAGLLVPGATRHVARRHLIPAAGGLYLLGLALALAGSPVLLAFALLLCALATVTFAVALQAAVLDAVPRESLGLNESTRMLYSAAAWTGGPVLGVVLLGWWRPLPFLVAGAFAALMALVAWRLRLGAGPARPAAAAGAHPLAYLRRFARRPRLVAGYSFATLRSCGWWVYVVYLPLFCVERGLGEEVGGAAASLSNGLLFATPLLLRLVHRWGVRRAVRGAFAWCALLFALGFLLAAWPWATVACLALASAGLVMLDVCGSLPFMMAVKPSERTEMAAVLSSFRDASGLLTPAVAGAVLLVAPTSAVFLACGAGLGLAWAVAGTVHPRLGRGRRRP